MRISPNAHFVQFRSPQNSTLEQECSTPYDIYELCTILLINNAIVHHTLACNAIISSHSKTSANLIFWKHDTGTQCYLILSLISLLPPAKSKTESSSHQIGNLVNLYLKCDTTMQCYLGLVLHLQSMRK